MKKILISILTLILCMSTSAYCAESSTFNASQKEQIEKIVRTYLINNPSILIDMSKALQKKKMHEAQMSAENAIQKNKDDLFNSANTPVYGNKKGTIQIIEFYDYQCGHCKAMAPIIDEVMKNNKSVKVISRDFPIFGKDSTYAALASMAAYQINADKYYELHQMLMESENQLSNDNVDNIIKKSGYSLQKIKKVMESDKIKQELKNNYRLAKALKLEGTPAFIIGNADLSKFRFIPGATPKVYLEEAINSLK